MAEEDITSDINESKEGSEVSESGNEDRDASKENISDTENPSKNKDESKENIPDSENTQENGDESKENISDSENTPKKSGVPLYDQPLTQSGKRVRAKAEQFIMKPKEETKYVYEFNGSGIALGEIPYIEAMINKELADDLKKLHVICLGRLGERASVKKHLRQFNGYSFDKSDKKFAAKQDKFEKLTLAEIKHFCILLGLERSGLKPDIVSRILDFLLKPEDHGKEVPSKKSKKKKRQSKSGKKKRSDAGKPRGSKKKEGDAENGSTANDTADSSDSGSEGSDSEPEEKPKKTPAKKPVKTPAKKTPAKKTPARKTPAKKTTAKRSKESIDSDSSDDEPLSKKTKAAPSNDEIKQKVEKILEGADLEEVTMKTVCKQIYDIYPGFDLTDRKGFIKETVKSIIS